MDTTDTIDTQETDKKQNAENPEILTPKISEQENSTQKNSGISREVIEKISEEINNMISYAVHNGIIINTEICSLVQNSSVDDLINAHNLLCKNISPATPKSIYYFKKIYEDGQTKSLFSKIPLVRNLILLSIFFLLIFMTTGLSPLVNNKSLNEGILNNNGVSLLINLGFLSSISGMGVVFYLLKTVSSSIKKGTLVPEDSIYYIALIILGLISGLLLSEVVSPYDPSSDGLNTFNKGLLALIGGFSSDAIFYVLQGIISKLKSLFSVSK